MDKVLADRVLFINATTAFAPDDGVKSDFPPGSLLARHHKAAVKSIHGYQLLVGALLDDFPVIDNKYSVGIAHSFQSVGDHNDRLVMG